MLKKFKHGLFLLLCVGLSILTASCGRQKDTTGDEIQKLKGQVKTVTVGYEDGSTILLDANSAQYEGILNECLEATVSIDKQLTLVWGIDYVEEKWKPTNKYVQLDFDSSTELVTMMLVQEEERYHIPTNPKGFRILSLRTIIFPLSGDYKGLIMLNGADSTSYGWWENTEWSYLGLEQLVNELRNPIKILSVQGPLEPINPGGPVVEITLENISAQNIISIKATLRLTKEFNFEFDVSPSKPLLPAETISSKLTLIGGGFSTDASYLLQIKGEIEDETTFDYTKLVQITVP